jgi:hypothetical protein
MRLSRLPARLAALATAVAIIVSCDNRNTITGTETGTGTTPVPTNDNTAPTVKIALATGAGTADTIVYIGGNMGVTITSTDAVGVSTLSTVLRTPSGSSIVDSITYTPTVLTATRPYTINVASIARGDRLVFTTTAKDASANTKIDSLRVTVADTATPVVTVTSKVGASVKGLDSVDVAVLATDAAGIDTAGMRLLFVRAQGDTVLVFSKGGKPATRTSSYALDLGFRISDTLPTGQYLLQSFATDKSGLSARNAGVFSFTLTDATRPTIQLLNPLAGGHVAYGDPLLVRARLTDNAGVASVTFQAFSKSGVDSLGTALETPRYTEVTANNLGPTRDTSVSRVMAANTSGPMPDSITVRAIVTDKSGNSTTITLRIAVVPTLSITSPSFGTTLKNGDVLTTTVTAGDTTGVIYYGYDLKRSDSVSVKRDSVLAPAGSYSATHTFTFTLPDSLQPGSYSMSAFSKVQSAVGGRTAVAGNISVADAVRPTIALLAPVNGDRHAVGDSLFVKAYATDNVGLKSVSLRAYSVRGDSALGTRVLVDRYVAITAPPLGSYPAGTRSDTLQRWLQVVTSPKVDSLADTLVVLATVTDVSGLVQTTQVKLAMTNGPKVTLVQPQAGDSLTKGDLLTIRITALSSVGVKSIGFSLTDSFPTHVAQVPDSVLAVPSAPNATVTYQHNISIPGDAAGVLIITPHATDVNGQPGAATSFRIVVRRNAVPPVPLVHQILPARVELIDSVTITATGSGLQTVGYRIRNSTGTTIDSGQVNAGGASSFGPTAVAFNVGAQFQGARVDITSFAIDRFGNVGYSVPASVNTPQTVDSLARRDTALVVYGQSFALPRNGIAGDLTVDTIRGNVFVSNTKFNRLERWSAAAAAATPSNAFDAVGVAVGSEPWGMVVQNDNDTLLVANSGGTNISKVCIAASCGGIREIPSKRLQTRNTYIFTVTEVRDPATGRIRLSATGPISYSDRPQYVQQSAGGRLYYSTKPTAFAPEGTIRYIDPKLTVPDPRQVYQYAGTTTDQATYVIFNSDSIAITRFQGTTPPSDLLTIYDHVYGDTVGGSCNGIPNTICGTDSVVVAAANKVNAQSGDIVARNDVDVNKLGLRDTTFVASSGDRSWIGFGEGNTSGGTGRVMMVNDPAGTPAPGFFSPAVTVRDLLENASESVTGLGVDLHGASVAVHGTQAYFAALENPFHLRLAGKYDTFDRGAGIAYHPSADLRAGFISGSPSDSTRTAFVASSNGSIEIVDAFNFVSRGSLQIKGTLYGPLRASLPFATDNVGIPSTDPRFVVLKLFGLTSNGLVVINLRAQDITPVP